VLALVAVAALGLPGGPVDGAAAPAQAATAQAATAPPAPYHPSRLSHLGDSRQVVVVTSRSWRSTTAVVRTYQRGSDGVWRARFPAVRARIGRHGFAPAAQRRQDTGTTPAGTFAVTRAFGRYADPGTALPYRRFDRDDWWPYDPRSPRTYNVFQHRRVAGAAWRRSWAEHLWSYGAQYGHAVVLDFNLPRGLYPRRGEWLARQPADTRRGGGIFLHASGPGATAGCVTVPLAELRRVLRWLDPAAAPKVVMGPESAIRRM
jgi:L,D-peptidoglycan transpeptidase YkuD (ErfK/YbiS/YcfS/YnhG family)